MGGTKGGAVFTSGERGTGLELVPFVQSVFELVFS